MGVHCRDADYRTSSAKSSRRGDTTPQAVEVIARCQKTSCNLSLPLEDLWCEPILLPLYEPSDFIKV